MAQDQAYFTAGEMAKTLKITGSTLRKYAGLLEDQGYKFEKDPQGRRFYSAADLSAIQKLMALAHGGAMSLKESAHGVYLWSINKNAAHDDTTHAAPCAPQEGGSQTVGAEAFARLAVAMQEQQETIARQAEELAAMRKVIERIAERQAEDSHATREALERLTMSQESAAALPAPEPEKDRPRGFFGRLFGRGH